MSNHFLKGKWKEERCMNVLLLQFSLMATRGQWRLQIGCCFFSDVLPLKVQRLCILIPCELVKMTSLAFREVGVGLLNAKRWKLTVWSHTAPGKPTLHSAFWEQWAASSKELIGTTLWLMFPGRKETWVTRSLIGCRDGAALNVTFKTDIGCLTVMPDVAASWKELRLLE